jgi:hypothetical protein
LAMKMEWARKAATARIAELQAEIMDIHKIFPDLIGGWTVVPSAPAEPAEAPADGPAAPRKRRKMSAEARAKIAAAQRRRWANVRAAGKKR